MMRSVILPAVILAVAALACSQGASSHQVQGRGGAVVDYSGWTSRTGGDCCGGRHCRPVSWRWNAASDREEIELAPGFWWPVDPALVIDDRPRDGGAHVCVQNGRVVCVALPSLGS